MKTGTVGRERAQRPPLGAAFYRIWASQTLSTIGSTLSVVGVAVHVYFETHNPMWLGVLSAVAALPFILVAPLLARLDRMPRRRTLVLADMFAAIGPMVALALAIAGQLEVWHLVGAALLSGFGNAVQAPVGNTLVPALVVPEAYGRANGLFQLGPAAGIAIGPAIATPLIAWFGITAVLLVDVATFAIALAVTFTTQFGDSCDMSSDGAANGDDRGWTSALVWLRTEGRPLIVLLAVMAIVNVVLEFYNLALLTLAADLGGAWSGVALGTGGVTMIVCSVALGRTGTPKRAVRGFTIGLLVTAVGLAVSASRPSFAIVVVGVVIALAPITVLNAGAATLFHEYVPASMHGRVFALRSTLARSLDPIGAIAAGFAVAHVASPAMSEGGWLTSSLGRAIGVGEARGSAVVLLAAAVVLVGLAGLMSVSRLLRPLGAPATEQMAGRREHADSAAERGNSTVGELAGV